MIKFKTLPKILAGKQCNIEGMDGNLLQNVVFYSIFRLHEGILRHKGSMKGACMLQGQIRKITSQSPGRLGNFPVLTLFFSLSLPNNWLTHPNKNYIFETI